MSIVTDDLVENLIQPPYVNPFYGKHTPWVVPRSDLDEEETRRYWRYHKRFPNEFAGAINKLLVKQSVSCKFITYDHLKNLLTYEQRTHSSNL